MNQPLTNRNTQATNPQRQCGTNNTASSAGMSVGFFGWENHDVGSETRDSKETNCPDKGTDVLQYKRS
jgi:hypothetical protein